MIRRLMGVGALVLLLSGCDSSLDRARDVLRIGYAVEAPYAFVQDGTVTGEAPEVARVVAQRLHLGRLEWRQVEFGRLFQELLEHRIDLVAAGTFITPERQKLVAFSIPTFRVREAVLLKSDKASVWTCFQKSTSPATWRYAVLDGSAEGPFLQQHGWPLDTLLVVPDAATGLAAIQSGLADALVLSAPSLRFMQAKTPSLTLKVKIDTQDTDPGNLGAFAFRPEDRVLRDAWNQALSEFLKTPDHLALVSPLGFTAQELP